MIARPELAVGFEQRVSYAFIVGIVQVALVQRNLIVTAAQARSQIVAVVGTMFDIGATLQHQDFQSALAQLLGGPSTAYA